MILNLQETEIPTDMDEKMLEIPDSVLEIENSVTKRRVATYISKINIHLNCLEIEPMELSFIKILYTNIRCTCVTQLFLMEIQC